MVSPTPQFQKTEERQHVQGSKQTQRSWHCSRLYVTADTGADSNGNAADTGACYGCWYWSRQQHAEWRVSPCRVEGVTWPAATHWLVSDEFPLRAQSGPSIAWCWSIPSSHTCRTLSLSLSTERRFPAPNIEFRNYVQQNFLLVAVSSSFSASVFL